MNALLFQALRRLADGRFHSGQDMARELSRSRASLSEALKRAPELGLEVFSVAGKGYKLSRPVEFLDAGDLATRLGEAGARLRLEIVDECDSTSTRLLARVAEGANSGACLACEWQSSGRGRRGRSWVGALGGSLLFSLLWRFERGAGQLSGLSLAVGIAIARALREAGVIGAQVKWPNDVVVGGRKLAGILVETSGEIQGPTHAVIGVGINFRLPEETLDRIDQPATDVASHSGEAVSRNALLAGVLAQMLGVLDAFERTGFAPLRDEWRSLHAYQGRRVRVLPPRELEYEAEVIDVAEDGTLIVAAGGRTIKLASAELIGVRPRMVEA